MDFSEIPYGLLMRLRNFAYDRGWLTAYKSSLKVISVGNLSLGGNGKTPLVLHLAKLIKDSGKRPVILSRGYGGTLAGPHLVSELDTAKEIGDEPKMLYAKGICPVVISRRRVLGAKLIEQQNLGEIIILDDGFQHRALERDLDIICAYVGSEDAIKQFNAANIIPYGYFREPKKAALKRANLLVFTSRSLEKIAGEVLESLMKDLPNKNLKVFSSSLLLEEISSADGTQLATGQKVDAFCALAQPEAFFISLKQFGLQVEKRYSFRDHSQFSEQEIAKILSQSEGRAVVCSEKDLVKLQDFKISSVFVARTKLQVQPAESFGATILGCV